MASGSVTTATVRWLVPRRLRRRWPSLIPLALVVAIGGGATLLALDLAWQTERAYPRYVERADVGDLEINPSLFTAEIGETIRNLPGVSRSTSSDLFFAWPGYDGEPIHYSDALRHGAANNVGVFGSVDGRYVTMDRLAYRDGRAPTGPNEAVVSSVAADELGVDIGDEVPVSFWRLADEVRAYMGEDPLMTPVGVEHLTISGIATFPFDVLPDDLYQIGFMVVSPDVAGRYPCDAVEPPPEADVQVAWEMTSPLECASSYRYWSLEVDGGRAGVDAVQEAFVREAALRNADLAPGMLELGRYLLISSSIDTDLRDVQRSVQPTVTALRVLGLASAVMTLAVFAIASMRALRRTTNERTCWHQLGLSRSMSTATDAVPIVLAATIGVFAALGIVWLLSPVGPVGTVRSVAADGGRALEVATVASAVIGWVALLAVTVGLAFHAAGERRAVERHERRSIVGRALAVSAGRPAIAEGVRGALGNRRDRGLTVSLGAIATAAIVAALTFGTSLSTLLDTPWRYGWPWDAAAMLGAGYSSATDVDEVGERLDELDEVTGWAGLGFWQSVVVDGTSQPTLIGFGGPSDLDLTVLEGRLPAERDEVGLGAQYAADRGIDVGDTVSLEGEFVGIDQATVTGLLVLPSLGPLQSDRASPGHGVLLREGALDLVGPYALLSFLGLNTSPGADPGALLQSLLPDLQRWDLNDSLRLLDEPLRPAPIAAVDEVRLVPIIVAAIVALTAAGGLIAALYATARARDHDVGILRALGFTRGQVRRMIVVQSLTTTAVALVIGVPLGVIAGGVAWRAYAGRIGVVTDPTVSGTVLVVTTAASLVVAVIGAVWPAERAARLVPAELLRRD